MPEAPIQKPSSAGTSAPAPRLFPPVARVGVEVMAGIMRHVSNIHPLTYVTRILQAPWLGRRSLCATWAVTCAITLAAAITALYSAGDNRAMPVAWNACPAFRHWDICWG